MSCEDTCVDTINGITINLFKDNTCQEGIKCDIGTDCTDCNPTGLTTAAIILLASAAAFFLCVCCWGCILSCRKQDRTNKKEYQKFSSLTVDDAEKSNEKNNNSDIENNTGENKDKTKKSNKNTKSDKEKIQNSLTKSQNKKQPSSTLADKNPKNSVVKPIVKEERKLIGIKWFQSFGI